MSELSFERKAKIAGRTLKNIVLGKPISVSFEITYNCNAKCKHCHLGDYIEEPRLSPEVFARRFVELHPTVAQISGGEPMLRKDLADIIREMRRHDPVAMFVITTNAQNLNEERYLKLREAGIDQFSLSLDYPDERQNEFRRLRKNFEHMSELVPKLVAHGHKDIILACVVQSDNFRDLPKVAELAKEWGVAVNFSTYNSLRTGNTDYLVSSETDLEELGRIVDRLVAMQRDGYSILTSEWTMRQMIRFFRDGRQPGCTAGKRFLIVNPQGTLGPCGLITQYYDSQRQMLREFTKGNECEDCYTSLRVNSEKSLRRLLIDALRVIRQK
ncbi:MAG: radical SAM protein [Candidatus Zixiibacteriota bacterium]|nr:MAG: radical SAM protein [candidate division Zixibacteria bacterium]